MGESMSGIEQFSAVMGIPAPPSNRPWHHHLNQIGKAFEETAAQSIQVAVTEIRELRGRERGQPLQESELPDEAVSFDGKVDLANDNAFFWTTIPSSVGTATI